MTDPRSAWLFVFLLLRALGLRLRRWGDRLIAMAEFNDGAGARARTLPEPVGMAVPEPVNPQPPRLVRTERGSVPGPAGALAHRPPAPQDLPPARPAPPAQPAQVAPQRRTGSQLARAPRPEPAIAPPRRAGAAGPGPGPGPPLQWQARAGSGVPPPDWAARSRPGPPQDWLDRVARQRAPDPPAARTPPAARLARALSLLLPRSRTRSQAGLPSSAVVHGALARTDRPALEAVAAAAPAPIAAPSPWQPEADERASQGGSDGLPCPRVPAAQRAWPAPAPAHRARAYGPMAGPQWQPAPGSTSSQRPPASPARLWPPLPAPERGADADAALAALREHERLRRIELEQRGG